MAYDINKNYTVSKTSHLYNLL